jgi:3-isopropylmalate/(R)-2-methylmalate dehydratase small subunit
MEPFKSLEAVAVPLDAANVDTDQIIPARFLWKQRNDGYGELLFNDLRLNADKSPRREFVLNRPEYRDARILVGHRNFGCGSSREHAVWALYDAGFRSVIAPSFGDIFYNNCFQNGLLPIVLPAERVAALMEGLAAEPGVSIGIDLPGQTVKGPDGVVDTFEISSFRKACLLNGHDEIAFTLSQVDEIVTFEKSHEARVPWL